VIAEALTRQHRGKLDDARTLLGDSRYRCSFLEIGSANRACPADDRAVAASNRM
jgi:hypothetical protein